jgi:general secretion pathway protein A
VLIIDEAQNLAADVLEQLRLLTNLETSERKLLQIVLIGQPELRDMLARPELEQLAQRVIARFHLDALSPAETQQYIGHRLGVAGHTGALPFEAKAMRRIHQLTRGVPRRINLLCGRALLGAWATGESRVNRKVVDKAAAEVFGNEPARPPQRLVYALAGGALLAALVLLAFQMGPAADRPQGTGRAAVPAASVAAPAASVSALGRQPAPAFLAAAIEDLPTLWPQLAGDINISWRELAPDWKLPADSADPCQTASTQGLSCYRAGKLTLPQLRQLDRPGILTLQAANAAPVFAVLVGQSDQTATLRLRGRLHTVRLVELAQFWRGDFATYWQVPPGYEAGLRDGSTGAAIDWLAKRLRVLDGGASANSDAAPLALDAALRERVRAFQRARGIAADGQPGPMTFMQLESATEGQAPRLITEPR